VPFCLTVCRYPIMISITPVELVGLDSEAASMTTKQQMRNSLFGRSPKNRPLPPPQSAFVSCPACVVLPNSLLFAQAIYQWAYTNAVLHAEASAPTHFDPNWN
jgi:hypothetical protein